MAESCYSFFKTFSAVLCVVGDVAGSLIYLFYFICVKSRINGLMTLFKFWTLG